MASSGTRSAAGSSTRREGSILTIVALASDELVVRHTSHANSAGVTSGTSFLATRADSVTKFSESTISTFFTDTVVNKDPLGIALSTDSGIHISAISTAIRAVGADFSIGWRKLACLASLAKTRNEPESSVTGLAHGGVVTGAAIRRTISA